MKNQKIEFTRISNDTNGNPRYVCHFLALINDDDRKQADENVKGTARVAISEMYDIAVRKAHKIGGRKYHNKQYGGGIVFQSYNIGDTEKKINEVKAGRPKKWQDIKGVGDKLAEILTANRNKG